MIEAAEGGSGGIERSLKIHSSIAQHWKNELKTSPAKSTRLKWKSFILFENPSLTGTYEIDSIIKK